jgi:hypothetical protein
MTERINRQWLLARRPVGMVSASDFEFKQEPVPELADGQYLVRNLYISLDPTMRGWMEDRESYMPPVSIGEVMRCSAVGQVIESKNPAFVEGDIVSGLLGMQEYAVAGQGFIHGAQVPDGTPLTWPLGVVGLTGMTAYFGLLELGKPVPGETVLVSGAAGATGSVAAQIAKLEGCRVVGIAGGPGLRVDPRNVRCLPTSSVSTAQSTTRPTMSSNASKNSAPMASTSTSTMSVARSLKRPWPILRKPRASCSAVASLATARRCHRPDHAI